MAGDWLKMRKDLTTDPAVIGIAARLGVTRFTVVGCLLEVWAWADTHTTDGNARSVTMCVTSALPDALTGVTGLGAAMIAAGWLIEHPDGIEFPAFERHNGQTAKQRALTAKRVAKHKATSNATTVTKVTPKVTAGALPREEKRREEIKTEEPPTPLQGADLEKPQPATVAVKTDPVPLIPLPPNLDTPTFREAWAEWIEARKARRKPLTERAARAQLADLAAKLDADGAAACVRDSIRNDWQGLFPDKHTPAARRAPNLFDRGAAIESRVMAQCREALADCPSPN